MTITYRGAVVRNIKSNYNYDVDAYNYIRSVESADGQTLEKGVKDAINTFIVGCKTDGIWDAIKASCIMAGARTLAGALKPLVGTAPVNNNFVSGDYNRKTGLVGDGATKYLDSNRNNNADPQNDNHNAVYVTNFGSGTVIIGTANESGGNTMSSAATRNRTSTADITAVSAIGFYGMARSVSGSYVVRDNATNRTVTQASQTPSSSSVSLFAGAGGANFSSARLSFYSIGEALDLALLDTRVTSLMAQLAFAINTGLSPVGYSSETIDYVNAGYAAGGTLA